MKNELQQTLIDLGFTVRLDKDGNEVADPSKSMKYIIDDDMGLFDNEEFENDIQAYEDATEAIKLPDPVEMWKELSRPSLKFDESYHIYDKYMHFIQTQLTKEMFVNEVEKPKQFEGALEFGVGKDYDDAIEYQKAEREGFVSWVDKKYKF